MNNSREPLNLNDTRKIIIDSDLIDPQIIEKIKGMKATNSYYRQFGLYFNKKTGLVESLKLKNKVNITINSKSISPSNVSNTPYWKNKPIFNISEPLKKSFGKNN